MTCMASYLHRWREAVVPVETSVDRAAEIQCSLSSLRVISRILSAHVHIFPSRSFVRPNLDESTMQFEGDLI